MLIMLIQHVGIDVALPLHHISYLYTSQSPGLLVKMYLMEIQCDRTEGSPMCILLYFPPMLVSIVQWVVSCLARNQFLQPINEGKTQNSRLVKHCIDLLKVGNSLTRKDSSNTCLELGMVISCWFRLVILCDLRPFYCLLIGRWLEKCRYSQACPLIEFLPFQKYKNMKK